MEASNIEALFISSHLIELTPLKRQIRMPLSTEAIISLISVIVNLPPALFIVWILYSRRHQPGDVHHLGKNDVGIKHLTKANGSDILSDDNQVELDRRPQANLERPRRTVVTFEG